MACLLHHVFPLGLMLLGLGLSPLAGAEIDTSKTIDQIAFGSCADQRHPQPIWEAIRQAQPDLFVFLGDNIYGDTEDMAVLKAKYEQLGAVPGYQKLKEVVPVLATWDDHDYGVNDGGAEYSQREESQQVFLDFFEEPQDSPRRSRKGVYDAKIFGPEGRRVQIILLDTRYHRSPLKLRAQRTSTGPYEPDEDPNKTMLGAEQWAWLEEQLRQPAEVRIIASSIQVVPQDHGWELWMNFPRERERLFDLIDQTDAAGVIFISGDRHLAELSMMDAGVGYPIFDVTSSSLNKSAKSWRPLEVNRNRVGTMAWGDNFGMIEIDWEAQDPEIRLQVLDEEGEIAIQRKIPLSKLQPGTIKK